MNDCFLTYLKETPTQVFPCEFFKSFKDINFNELLRTAGSKIPVRGFLFNKAASMTVWRPLTVLERDSSTGILL